MKPEVTVFIRQIREINGFNEFLKEIEGRSVPIYKPVKSDDRQPPDVQAANWHYESGRSFENARIIKLLIGE